MRHRHAYVFGLVLTFSGCWTTSRAEPIGVSAPVAPVRSVVVADSAPILSAHLAVVDVAAWEGSDGVPVVFSAKLDPMTVEAMSFAVRRSDGSVVIPEHAYLAPANEVDEHRTVLLVGDFHRASECTVDDDKNETCRPIHPRTVIVTGVLFTVDGRRIDGVATEIEPFETPGRVVTTEHLPPGEGRCSRFAAVLRTYWLDGLRGVETEDLEKITVTSREGQPLAVRAFDDHDMDDESGEDNVLDLCLDGSASPTHLRIDAGVFLDPSGHVSARVDMEIAGERSDADVGAGS